MTAELKRIAAERAVADYIREGQIVGLGTGSTAEYAIRDIGRRVAEGLRIKAIPTSSASERVAVSLQIPLVDLNDYPRVDVTIDGTDQIDDSFNMIKGGGGALLREKLVAQTTDLEVIVADDSKLVRTLGRGFPLPVEIIPFGWKRAARQLGALGSKTELRVRDGKPFLTDSGNYIVDCDFGAIDDAPALERDIKLVSGVVESGLFIRLADVLVIGNKTGAEIRKSGSER